MDSTRPSIHRLIEELSELREWMLANGVTHARAGDLELEVELAEVSEASPVAHVERSAYDNPYDDPDLWPNDPSPDKQPGDRND